MSEQKLFENRKRFSRSDISRERIPKTDSLPSKGVLKECRIVHRCFKLQGLRRAQSTRIRKMEILKALFEIERSGRVK